MTKPSFRVEANGTDLTTFIQQRLLMLRIYDESGFKNDRMELSLDNRPPYVDLPDVGTVFTVYMGYDTLRQMGEYESDTATLAGPPLTITIVAHAKSVASDIKATQNRSWHATTIGNIVKKIAGDHGMTPAISSDLASTTVDHVDQTHQSDMGFLTDLARNNNAIMKMANGQIYFAPRDQAKSIGGDDVQSVTIAYTEDIAFSYLKQSRSSYDAAAAVYQDKDTGQERVAVAGTDDGSAKTGGEVYSNPDEAKAAAAATKATLDRSKDTLEITIPGNPDLMSESPVTITGFPPGIPTSWLADRVQHTMDGRGAYVTTAVLIAPSADTTDAGTKEEPRDNVDGGDDGYTATESVDD